MHPSKSGALLLTFKPKPMKILIAYDHQIVRYGIRLLVKDIWPKAMILEAENLNNVVNLISDHNISLMIFDINISGADKLEELIRFIIRETKVVIFSGYQKTNLYTERLLANGVDIFIFKDSPVAGVKKDLAKLFAT